MPDAVSIQTCKAPSGLAWLRAGLRLLGRQPLPTIMLVALGPLLNLSLALVPYVGQALGLLLFPMILLGMLTVCRAAEQGTMPGLSSYTAGLQAPRARLRLFQVGIAYALAVGLVSLVWTLVLPEERAAAPTSPVAQVPAPEPATAAPGTPPQTGADNGAATPALPPQPPPDTVGNAAVGSGTAGSGTAGNGTAGNGAIGGGASANDSPNLALTPMRVFVVAATLVISVPLQMTVLFAAVLVSWHGLPAPKALFFGFFAGWRNRAPILITLFGIFGLGVVCLLVLTALIALLGLSEEAAQFLLLSPVLLLLLPVGTASSYAMLQDIIQGERMPTPATVDGTAA